MAAVDFLGAIGLTPALIERQIPKGDEVAHVRYVVRHVDHHPSRYRLVSIAGGMTLGILDAVIEDQLVGELGRQRARRLDPGRDRPVGSIVEHVLLKQVFVSWRSDMLAVIADDMQPARAGFQAEPRKRRENRDGGRRVAALGRLREWWRYQFSESLPVDHWECWRRSRRS